MTKQSLQNWYNSSQINYSEKERLNKIGINDYEHYNLQDLKQILLCEEWAKNSSEIRNKLSGRTIKKIVFFTPVFNDSKPDASNYSCAIVELVNSSDAPNLPLGGLITMRFVKLSKTILTNYSVVF